MKSICIFHSYVHCLLYNAPTDLKFYCILWSIINQFVKRLLHYFLGIWIVWHFRHFSIRNCIALGIFSLNILLLCSHTHIVCTMCFIYKNCHLYRIYTMPRFIRTATIILAYFNAPFRKYLQLPIWNKGIFHNQQYNYNTAMGI